MKETPFDPMTYPIVIRIVKGYLTISQPDLDISITKKTFREIKSPTEIGQLYLEVLNETVARYKVLSQKIPASSNEVAIRKKRYLKISEVAELLSTSETTIRRMCKAGKLKSIKSPGGHRLFDANEIIPHL